MTDNLWPVTDTTGLCFNIDMRFCEDCSNEIRTDGENRFKQLHPGLIEQNPPEIYGDYKPLISTDLWPDDAKIDWQRLVVRPLDEQKLVLCCVFCIDYEEISVCKNHLQQAMNILERY